MMYDVDRVARVPVPLHSCRHLGNLVRVRSPFLGRDQLARMDGLVEAWLPGSEGAGVADTLFGVRPFTGKLPVTWPRTLSQEPINRGDANYDPLYRFGYGLTTG